MKSSGAKLAEKLGQTATAAEIAAACDAYKAEDARIKAEKARQELARCDEWRARTGGTREEYFTLANFSDIWREKLAGV